jgi:hypothetical protein
MSAAWQGRQGPARLALDPAMACGFAKSTIRFRKFDFAKLKMLIADLAAPRFALRAAAGEHGLAVTPLAYY